MNKCELCNNTKRVLTQRPIDSGVKSIKYEFCPDCVKTGCVVGDDIANSLPSGSIVKDQISHVTKIDDRWVRNSTLAVVIMDIGTEWEIVSIPTNKLISGPYSCIQDGKTGYLNFYTPGAVAIIPFLDDPDINPNPKFMYINQRRPAIDACIAEIPAGTRDINGEPTHICALRELSEETGHEAKFYAHLGTIVTSPGYSNETIDLFAAKGLTKIAGPEDGITTHTTKVKKALKTFVDAKTIAALGLWKTKKRKLEWIAV